MNLPRRRVQVDEVWASLCQARECPHRGDCPPVAGDIWTWVGFDADSKLAVSWHAGGRDVYRDIRFVIQKPDDALYILHTLIRIQLSSIRLAPDFRRKFCTPGRGAASAKLGS